MPAAIEIRDGKASFFSAKEPAWHRLGTVTEDVLTATEALETAGLDWNVEKFPIQWLDADQNAHAIPDRFAIVRDVDNKQLGVVSPDYKIFQNHEVFNFFDTVVDSGEAKYETAGSLQGGRKVFLTAKIGDTFEVAGEDAHDMYLLMTTSHDGTQAFMAATTMIRAVCQNTVTLALSQAKSKWTLRHKSTLEGRTQEARDSLGLAFKYQEAFEAEVEALMSIEMEKDAFLKIVTDLLPEQKRKKERNLEDLMSVFENEPTVKDAAGAGTAWGALNAVTYWTDWVRESRSDEARFKSLTDGTAATLRSNFRTRALTLA